MSSLYAIIPTFRRPAELADSLQRLARQTRVPDVIVIVDNDASEECRRTVDRLRASLPIRYVESPENLGFCGGVAFGMEKILPQAKPNDWIVILDDDDPLPGDDIFFQLERFAWRMSRRDSRTACVGLVGARFDWKKGSLVRVGDAELNGPVSVDVIGGNSFPFYSVRALREGGIFSKDIFFGLSEVEHGLRLRRAGYSIYAHGDLWRERRAEQDRLGLTMRPSLALPELNWRRYYSLRNSIYILRSHGRWGTAVRVTALKGLGKPLVNIVRSPKPATALLRLNVRACYDGWAGRMGRRINPDGSARPAA